MTTPASEWFMLTPAGALHAFARAEPGESELALQALLTGDRALDAAAWSERAPQAPALVAQAIQEGWVQVLHRPLQGPDAKLDDFLQHVIASLSGERRAVLASEGGFCLGRSGIDQDEADALSAAAADYSDFAARQARRGWSGAKGLVSFHVDADFLLPTFSFVPLWVDGAGYWLIVAGWLNSSGASRPPVRASPYPPASRLGLRPGGRSWRAGCEAPATRRRVAGD